MYICNSLFYTILNIFEYISKYYGIPYYMKVIFTACHPFLSFVKMV